MEVNHLNAAFLEPGEVARILRVSERHLRKSRCTGELYKNVPTVPYLKLGGRVRYRPQDVNDWLEQLPRYTSGAEVSATEHRQAS